MKWSEPWRPSIQRQKPYRTLSASNLKSASLWTAAFLAIGLVNVFSDSVSLEIALQRSWVALVFGCLIALVTSFGHWASPIKVLSGPRGIVVSKGEVHNLIPWETIHSYAIHTLTEWDVLELQVTYSNNSERLYLPKGVNRTEIESELQQRAGIRDQK
jgi:hypothetical protein